VDLVDEEDGACAVVEAAVCGGGDDAAQIGHELSTPLSLSKRDWVAAAMISARLVLPVPGGPKRRMEEMRSASMARRRSLPWARMCSCPTYSSRVRGRIRSASGASDGVACAGAWVESWVEKRSDIPGGRIARGGAGVTCSLAVEVK
jgi:hypothetical protein